MKAHNVEVDHGTLHFGRFLLKPFRLHGRCCPAQPGEDQEEAGLVEDLRRSHGPWPVFVPEVARWSHPGPDPGDLGPDPGDPGSEEEENFYASVLAVPSGRSSAKPWRSSASSCPLAAWHSSAKQRRD